MAFQPASTLAQLPPGSMIEVLVCDREIALCNVEGRIYAVDGVCPHLSAPLAQGALHGSTLVCPWHAWEFDCITGQHERNPSLRLDTFAVRIEGDDILIEVPGCA